MESLRVIIFGEGSIHQHITRESAEQSKRLEINDFLEDNSPEFKAAVYITEREDCLKQRIKEWECLMREAGSFILPHLGP